MPWTDDDEARECILMLNGVLAEVVIVAGRFNGVDWAAEMLDKLERVKEIAKRIDAPRPNKETI